MTAQSHRPRIGVTRWEDVPGEAVDRYWARVTEAGGEVIDLNEEAVGQLATLAPTLDALMLTGGVDVDPARYGAPRHEKVRETAPERDAMELAYVEQALQRDLPVLAICRGHQLLNVAFGGSLVQHVEGGEHRADFRTEGYPSRWHAVRLDAGSRVAGAVGATSLEINSRHHQAVNADTLGAGLRVTGRADDSAGELVEAIESEQHRWVVGVQWHPERLEEQRPPFAPVMRGLFAAFIARAREP